MSLKNDRVVHNAAKYADILYTHSYIGYMEYLIKKQNQLQKDIDPIISNGRRLCREDDLYWYQQSLEKEIRLIAGLRYRIQRSACKL